MAMDDAAAVASTVAHLVAVPYPGRGHVNALLSFCDILLRCSPHGSTLIITFVVTEEWLGIIGSSESYKPHPHFRFSTLPNVIPSERNRGADHPGFVRAVMTNMEPHFEQLIAAIDDPRPTAVIADILPWVIDVANRQGVPVFSFFPMPPPFFSFCLHYKRDMEPAIFPSIRDPDGRGQHSTGGSSKREVMGLKDDDDGGILTECLPGVGCGVRVADFTSILRYSASSLEMTLGSVRSFRGVILNTVYELDVHSVDALRADPMLSLPVYTIGPCIRNLFEDATRAATAGVTLCNPAENATVDCITWLDSQAEGSVLFISLGSFMPISAEQMEELAQGLLDSGSPFLWALREECRTSDVLLKALNASAGRGLTVAWCDQRRVLCHPSVGAFLTHCGWNSTLEGLCAGKPMLAFPIFWDQPVNSAMVSEGWGVGVRLKEAGKEKDVVGRTVVADAVKKVMSPAGDRFRRRAGKLKEVCLSAFKDGSSLINLGAFVQDALEAGKHSNNVLISV